MVLRHAPRLPAELVPLDAACGLCVAEAVIADRDYPPFPRAMMDGYAVRLDDAGRRVRVIGELAAGKTSSAAVVPGRCVEIMTGAACPAGTEAVTPKEDVQRQADHVLLPRSITAGQHIAPPGSECRAGQTVLEAGGAITPLAVAALASLGRGEVRAHRRPALALITTGDELVEIGQEPPAGQIRNSNGPMLTALASAAGLRCAPRQHCSDQPAAILAALHQTAGYEIVLLSGGVSTGTYDLVPQAVQAYGAKIVFHKVAQKPGKPLLFARNANQLLFGLPGNPLACHFCFHRYVLAAARQMAWQPPLPPPHEGRLTAPLAGTRARTYFATGRAQPDPRCPDCWRLHPLPGASSADIFGTAAADCYLEVPPDAQLSAGDTVRFTWIGGRC